MTIIESRARIIDEYLKNNPESANTGIRSRVKLADGSYRELTVYRFPIDILRFRLENTRFAVKKYTYEKKHGAIDQETPEGKDVITSFLLYKENTHSLMQDAKELIEDVRQHGQLEPAVITWAGYVLNGNRRLASLIYLYDGKKDPTFQYLNACRLPKTATDKDLFTVEADLQWAKDFKSQYDPLAKYKMLEQARKLYTIKEIAELTRKSVGTVKTEIEELNLLRSYLKARDDHDSEDFVKLAGQTEVFTEAARIMQYFEKSKKKTTAEYQKMFFKFVDVNRVSPKTITHKDMRQVNKAFRHKVADAIKLYKKINTSLSIKEIKSILDEGKYAVREFSIAERPDKIAQELYKNARQLYRVVKLQKLSKSTVTSIKKTIELLSKIIS